MKDIIKTLIEKRKIKKIVYVDNEFEIDVYRNNIKLFLLENISNPSIQWPFLIEAGIDYASEECEKWLNNPENSNAIIDFIKENDIKREASPVEKKLNEILPEDILFCVTPCEFKEQYVDNPVFTPTEDQQLVILMDKYIKGDDGNSGMRLLAPFENKDYIACGLFSNRFNINEELEHWSDCNKATNIYPLSKSRVTTEDEGQAFLLGLRHIVWLRQISDIKNHILDLYQKAFVKTQEDLNLLDPASFDYAIIKSSAYEGCWEFDTMKRIMLILLNQHVEKLMIEGNEFPKIQELTHTLKQISAFPQCTDKPDSNILRSFYKSEVYDDISYINKTYSQIANGDIFEIEGKGKFMLSCQPCNLELRENASRKSSEFVYLLPIEPTFILTENSPEQIKKQNRQLYRSLLQRLSDSESLCVNLALYKRISPLILDLVSYNKNGKAIININIDKDQLEDSQIMQANMLAHYHKIYSTICNHVRLCNKINELPRDTLNKGERQSLLKMLKKPFEMASERLISADYNIESSIIDFKIKRVGRYKEPFSQIILHDFMNYLSRQALPNDFSKIN